MFIKILFTKILWKIKWKCSKKFRSKEWQKLADEYDLLAKDLEKEIKRCEVLLTNE